MRDRSVAVVRARMESDPGKMRTAYRKVEKAAPNPGEKGQKEEWSLTRAKSRSFTKLSEESPGILSLNEGLEYKEVSSKCLGWKHYSKVGLSFKQRLSVP